MIRYALLVGLTFFAVDSAQAETRNAVSVTGATAKSIRVLDGVETKDGELGVQCSAKSDLCHLFTKRLPLRWEDDADGEPFFVEQSIDPMPYTTGGTNPVTEVRTLGGSDDSMSLVIQCEQRRYWTECLARKVTEKGPATRVSLNCTESVYPTSYPLTLIVEGERATVTPRAYGQEADGVDFKVEATLGTGSRVNVRGSGFEFSVVPTYNGEWAGELRAPGLHSGSSVEVRCRP